VIGLEGVAIGKVSGAVVALYQEPPRTVRLPGMSSWLRSSSA